VQLVPAGRVVEQINGSGEIEGAQRREGCSIMDLIGDAERLRPFVCTPQADHLRGDVDPEYLGRPVLLEELREKAQATGHIQDALAAECPRHSQDRVHLGPSQRGCPRELVVFAADVVVLCAWLGHGGLLVFVPSTGHTLRYAER
jgi:hypothetical protein